MSNIELRLITGIAFIALILAAILLGPVTLYLLFILLAMLMALEWVALVGSAANKNIQFYLAAIIGILLAIAGIGGVALGLIVFCIMLPILIAISYRQKMAKRVLVGGVSYLTLPFFSLLWLYEGEGGRALVLLIFLSVWVVDVFAFLAGKSIGGAKLAPKISPNKTWAGLIGGVLAAFILGTVYPLFTDILPPLQAGLLCVVMAVLAQGGDLFESALKRKAGVKDSGNILPGHGGLLDRMDGLVMAAMGAGVIALCVSLFQPSSPAQMIELFRLW